MTESSKNDKWAIGIAIGSLIVSVLGYWNSRSELDNMQRQLNLQEKQYTESQVKNDIAEDIKVATTQFIRAGKEDDYDTVFNSFLDIHQKDPTDDTGHTLFYERAEEVIDIDKKLGDKLMNYSKQLKPKKRK